MKTFRQRVAIDVEDAHARPPQLAGGDVDRLVAGEHTLGFLPVEIAFAGGSGGRRNGGG